MRDSHRRLWACTLVVLSSIAVTEAQQQRGRGADKTRIDLAADAGGVVTSVDADGVPKFVWAAGAKPGPADATDDGAARWHVSQFSRALAVTPADVSAAETVGVQTLPSGDVIVALRQRLAGVEVMGSEVRVLMRADHKLVAISGRPRSTDAAQMRWARSREDALAAALSAQFGASIAASSITTETAANGEQRFRIAAGSGLDMSEAAPVRPVMFPVGGHLVAAYFIEFYAGAPDSVDAASLRRRRRRRPRARPARLTISEKFSDPPAGRRRRTSSIASTPSRPINGRSTVRSRTSARIRLVTPTADLAVPAVESVTMAGFNHPPSGVPDPCSRPMRLTNGNNADAYVDFSAPDGSRRGRLRAHVTSARAFDRTYDTTLD